MKAAIDNIKEREQVEVKALLNEKQFKQYIAIMKEMKPRKGPPRGGKGPGGQSGK